MCVDLGADLDGEGEEVSCGVDGQAEGISWTVFESTDLRAHPDLGVDEE